MTQTASCEQPPVPSPSRPGGPFLDLDPDVFLPRLNTRACFLRHRLTDHPLFDVPRLLELARWLPEKDVRINSGAVPIGATPEEIPGTGLSLEESFQRLGDSDTRIMLKKIELHPEYRELLYACLAEIEGLGHPATRAVTFREGYVFLSAPNMVTPFHMDPEINFLLQVRGRKTFHVLPGDDRSVLADQDIEVFYAGKPHSLRFKEEARPRATPFAMGPGDGVHIPVNHPHWVTTDKEITISFALTLQTEALRRRATVYAVNHYLRRCGLKPRPFGCSAVRDFFKLQGYGLWGLCKACLPRRRRTPEH
jgi:hypothetical protein